MTESIDRMVFEIAEILNQQIYSAWLYGSVVMNDFRLGWSDIDLIVFSNSPITDIQAEKLLMLRQSLSAMHPENPYYRCFEGAIVNLYEYLSGSCSNCVYWGTTGQRITNRYSLDAFSRYELAKYGKLLYGKNDRELFLIPSREEIISAIQYHYETIRKYATQTDESLYSCGWLLDIARCIYTLRFNDIIGKTQAGIWALDENIFSDREPMKKALEIRRQPNKYKGIPEIKLWLSSLGKTVQQYADVLEKELKQY